MGRLKATLIDYEPSDADLIEMFEEMLRHMPPAVIGEDYELEED